MLIPLSTIRERSERRSPGYADAIIAAGRIVGDQVEICPSIYAAVSAKFRSAETPLPPGKQRAINALNAALRAAGRVVRGESLTVSSELEAARLVVCQQCPDYRHSDNTCGLCGCFTAGRILRKAKLASENCPAGRWPAAESYVTQAAVTRPCIDFARQQKDH